MAKVSKEKSIWRQLCRFHWSPAQIEYIIQLHRELRVQKNWQQVYDRLRRWVLGDDSKGGFLVVHDAG